MPILQRGVAGPGRRGRDYHPDRRAVAGHPSRRARRLRGPTQRRGRAGVGGPRWARTCASATTWAGRWPGAPTGRSSRSMLAFRRRRARPRVRQPRDGRARRCWPRSRRRARSRRRRRSTSRATTSRRPTRSPSASTRCSPPASGRAADTRPRLRLQPDGALGGPSEAARPRGRPTRSCLVGLTTQGLMTRRKGCATCRDAAIRRRAGSIANGRGWGKLRSDSRSPVPMRGAVPGGPDRGQGDDAPARRERRRGDDRASGSSSPATTSPSTSRSSRSSPTRSTPRCRRRSRASSREILVRGGRDRPQQRRDRGHRDRRRRAGAGAASPPPAHSTAATDCRDRAPDGLRRPPAAAAPADRDAPAAATAPRRPYRRATAAAEPRPPPAATSRRRGAAGD